MPCTTQGVAALADNLQVCILTHTNLSRANVEHVFNLLEQTRAAIEENTQAAWKRQLHAGLAKHLQALVALTEQEHASLNAADPFEDLLYTACDGLLLLIEQHANDTRAVIGSHVLHSLARIAVNQQGKHTGRVVQVAIEVHCLARTPYVVRALAWTSAALPRYHVSLASCPRGRVSRSSDSRRALQWLG